MAKERRLWQKRFLFAGAPKGGRAATDRFESAT
jgi:hypothetical protein